MVPCDVSVPRAKGMFVSPDGGVAQLGATVTATVTAVTTLASPTLSSVLLMARFMLPPDLLASLRGYAARHPEHPGGLSHQCSADQCIGSRVKQMAKAIIHELAYSVVRPSRSILPLHLPA